MAPTTVRRLEKSALIQYTAMTGVSRTGTTAIGHRRAVFSRSPSSGARSATNAPVESSNTHHTSPAPTRGMGFSTRTSTRSSSSSSTTPLPVGQGAAWSPLRGFRGAFIRTRTFPDGSRITA